MRKIYTVIADSTSQKFPTGLPAKDRFKPQYRRIGGKRFKLNERFLRKSEADGAARDFRDMQFYVRMIRGTIRGRRFYDVYIRKIPGTGKQV